jgi:uncharacterized ferritin-like protein (DUF455 family)
MSPDLFADARACLHACDPDAKCAAVAALKAGWDAGRFPNPESPTPVESVIAPGRPERPELVSPFAVGKRSAHTRAGRAALIHALAHIEFNAINLALDAVYRFRDLPRDYYGDWLQVAAEEVYHFTLLRDHLRTLGYDYGDFPAHNGLWEMAVKTAHDALTRMALVPRVLEARGLDASPALIRKLRSAGDARAVEILEIILRDEIGHVRIGNRWYAWLCAQRGLEPVATFRELLEAYGTLRLRPPFYETARRAAGFSEDELALLEELAAPK